MSIESREVHLKSRPDGMPKVEDYALVTTQLAGPSSGEVLVRNIYISVDPYMRGRMREGWELNRVMEGGALGKVIESNNDQFTVGDYVSSNRGWREYFVSDGRGLMPVNTQLAPLPSYLGAMGGTGLTAYGGLLITGQLEEGETVFVSAAAGAVGSVAGQIAKIKNCRVIGSAGSDRKVNHLVNDYHFDHAFNYKTSNILAELQEGAPDGIDVYFENVGGPQLEAALEHMRPLGRIPVCGMIAHYNDTTPTPGPTNLKSIIYNRVTMKGFVASEFMHVQAEFRSAMSGWIKEGRIKYQETIVNGIELAASAFIGLFSGENEGKMLVKLADE
jgi:NADPH-dependent curcumin reductase CurA